MFKEAIRQFLYIPLVNLLIFLIWLLPNHSAGLAIIIITILIRFILLAPSRKAIQSQQRVKDLQPKIDAIRREFADNKQKQSVEIMSLYKRENVSMFGSCLPTLIQFPVLIALYYAFQNGLDPARQALLYDFVPHPEFIKTTFFGLELTKPDKTYILPVMAGLLQYLQTRMMMPKATKDSQKDPNFLLQKNMTLMFPIMTVVISRGFAAALPLYWVVSSAFSLVQQWLIMKKRKNTPVKTTAVETGYNPSLQSNNHQQIKIPETKEIKSGIEVVVRRKK